ncbi:alpha-kinase family domain-containing protein [Ditylenchus destructor]|nr:alpha-kinase family domain-containing protein [Ditylenchus destructor]
MAFSHWTYQVSQGYLMVVDLQGIKSTDENGRTTLELTDPAIHCTDELRFGRTNMGYEGMKIFFARHKCNKFCQGMELKEHESTTSCFQLRSNLVRTATCHASVAMEVIANFFASPITLIMRCLNQPVLSIEIKPGENRYMSCERRYGNDCKFLRFSNNADYEMLESTCKINDLNVDIVEILMAFSHWTYEVSQGYLMVVDLQGIKSTDENGRTTLELTDPAIHCTDVLRFGRTNMGLEGMKIFFAHHKCNKFCQGMELKEHESTTQ